MSSSPSRPVQGRRITDAYATSEIPRIHSSQIDNTGPKLGQGTYGYVEKAKLNRGGGSEPQYVAIKYATDRLYVQNLINEAKTMMTLMSHPNVIKIYGIYEYRANTIGLVMEFMDCRSLAELLQNRSIDYTIAHFASWMLQLSSAVDYFHSNKQVHRDLKVQNMLLSNKYRTMKLCDFGTYTDVRSTMTATRGTPITMAPEVMTGKQYDMKSDIYSIGIIMWQILSREEPYQEANAIAVYYAVMTNRRPQDLQCSYILSGFYKRCWDQDPTVRPTSTETVQYFTLLCKEYPDGNVPIIDPNAMPNHLKVKTHRRTGSDTGGIKSGNSSSAGLGGSPAQSAVVGSSSADGIASPHRPAPPPPVNRHKDSWNVEDSLKPVEPDIRDPDSLQIYNNHMAELERLKNIKKLQQDFMSLKHDKLAKWKLLEQLEYLKNQLQNLPDSVHM